MVLRDVCGLPTRTLSPSVQLTRTTTDNRGNTQHRKQAGREASWLKQVRKVKRVGESEEWVTSDKTQGGGGVKKTLVKKLLIGAKVEWNQRKDLITYVDKPTTVQQGGVVDAVIFVHTE